MKEREMSKIVRSLRRGQITIPAEFRKELGIEEDTLLKLTLSGEKLEITPVKTSPAGSSWAKDLYDLFAPVRKDASSYSKEEIDETIDRAIAEVRGRR